MGFSDRLKALRKQQGKTTTQCAADVGVTQPAWNQWELGLREPKFDKLREICRLLDCSADELLGLPERGGSATAHGDGAIAAVKVSNSPGVAVANGRNARASVGPNCEQCPFKLLAMEFKDRAAKLPRKR